MMFLILKKKDIISIMALIAVFSFSIVCFSAYSSKNEVKKYSNTIIIDPGHGGEDSGAIGAKGTLEKDLNLKIALKLKDNLIKNGFNVILTRDKDIMLSNSKKNKKKQDLLSRIDTANNCSNGIFISIHMNYFPSEKEKGAQVFYSTNNDDSFRLATNIENSIKENLDKNNKRALKAGNKTIFIMKHINIPACLVECGFISNPDEETQLKTENYQNKLVQSITTGIKNFIKNC